MTLWQTHALRGPNRWSNRSVLELYLSQEIAFRSVPFLSRIARTLQDFLDSERYTTTHPQSVPTARSVVEELLSPKTSSPHFAEVWLQQRWRHRKKRRVLPIIVVVCEPQHKLRVLRHSVVVPLIL
ncbi:MAG: hypothetical protein ACKO9Q_31975, partial [Pirellula sp.]